MTHPTATPVVPSPATGEATPAVPDRVDGVDIRQVISGSTADVPVAELSRKGLKHVKVLNQAAITKLIAEAVDRVIAARSKKIGKEEREKVIQESRSHFEAMAKDRLQKERDRIGELDQANESLLRENEDLRKRFLVREEEVKALLAAKDAEIARLAAAPPPAPDPGPERFAEALLARLQAQSGGGNLEALQKSIQAIATKLDRLPAGGGRGQGPVGGVVDEEAMIDALFRVSSDSAETNVAQIKVKEAKAGGVKDTLAKLKALHKGG